MKKTLFAMFSSILILLCFLLLFTLSGRLIRQNEIDHALSYSMKQAMELLLMENGTPSSVEDWETFFINSVAVQIESQSRLTIHIYEIDMEKGLLSAEALLTFQNPIGNTSSVTTGKHTILLEKYEQ